MTFLVHKAPASEASPPPPTSYSLLCPSNNKEIVTYRKLAFPPKKVLWVKIRSTYPSVPVLGWGGREGRACVLPEALPAPLLKWLLLLPGSSSSYPGTSCRRCHGDALFLRRQGKGDGERKRTTLTAAAPNCDNCPLQNTLHRVVLRVPRAQSWRNPDQPTRSFNPHDDPRQ